MKQELQTIGENWAEEKNPSQYPQRTHADMAFSSYGVMEKLPWSGTSFLGLDNISTEDI
jgi:hypothetical protein